MDTIEITLPFSKELVVLRNYTTRGDDQRAETVLYAGVNATAKGDDQTIDFPIANVMASKASYIPRLVVSINGDTMGLADKIENLRSEDYEALDSAVSKIVDEHSPKAKAAKAATKNS